MGTDFKVFILCGQGKNMAPLSSVRASGVPKALLPMANVPVIDYTLKWCETIPNPKVFVCCLTSDEPEISAYVDLFKTEHPTSTVASNLTICSKTDAKSGDFIVELTRGEPSDFIVVGCDFVTDIPASSLVDTYRSRDSDSLLTAFYYPNTLENVDKKTLLKDVTVHSSLDSRTPRLLDSYSRDYIENKKTMPIRRSMLWHFPKSLVSTQLLNASVYFCTADVCRVITETQATPEEDSTDEDPDTRSSSPVRQEQEEAHTILAKGRQWDRVVRDIARRSWAHAKPLKSVSLCVLDSHTFARANNLSAYMEMNRVILKARAKANATTAQKPAPAVKGAATVGVDSLVGEETQLGERTSIKRSVVGNNCTIGKRCRINGCVIFDGAFIADDVTLENCLVGTKTTIGTKAKLTGCNVEGGYKVEAGKVAKNETMLQLSLEGLMESDEYTDDQDEDDDDDDDSEMGDSDDWSVSGGDDYDDDDGLFDRS